MYLKGLGGGLEAFLAVFLQVLAGPGGGESEGREEEGGRLGWEGGLRPLEGAEAGEQAAGGGGGLG